jgi:rhodanese-like protein
MGLDRDPRTRRESSLSDSVIARDPTGSEHRSYTREEIRGRLGDSGLVIANVLPRAAYEGARIPGSISLPVDEIPRLAPVLLPDLDREIVVYCGGPT